MTERSKFSRWPTIDCCGRARQKGLTTEKTDRRTVKGDPLPFRSAHRHEVCSFLDMKLRDCLLVATSCCDCSLARSSLFCLHRHLLYETTLPVGFLYTHLNPAQNSSRYLRIDYCSSRIQFSTCLQFRLPHTREKHRGSEDPVSRDKEDRSAEERRRRNIRKHGTSTVTGAWRVRA